MDGLGNPLRFILTPGQASDSRQAEPLLAGFPAQNVLADKGYDSQKIVDAVEQSSAKAVIPPRSCVKNPRDTDFISTPSAIASKASSTNSNTTAPSPLATPNGQGTSQVSCTLCPACSG